MISSGACFESSISLRAVRTFSLWLSAAFLCLMITSTAGAEEVLAQPADNAPMSVLDGKTFKATLGRGDDAPIDDFLVFKDGLFVSKECEARCGYAEAKYWVRAEGDTIEMFAESPCLRSDAIIIWEGTIKGEEIEGTYTWINKRWYWTFEKEFEFKGRLVDVSTATNN